LAAGRAGTHNQARREGRAVFVEIRCPCGAAKKALPGRTWCPRCLREYEVGRDGSVREVPDGVIRCRECGALVVKESEVQPGHTYMCTNPVPFEDPATGETRWTFCGTWNWRPGDKKAEREARAATVETGGMEDFSFMGPAAKPEPGEPETTLVWTGAAEDAEVWTSSPAARQALEAAGLKAVRENAWGASFRVPKRGVRLRLGRGAVYAPDAAAGEPDEETVVSWFGENGEEAEIRTSSPREAERLRKLGLQPSGAQGWCEVFSLPEGAALALPGATLFRRRTAVRKTAAAAGQG